jgi:hypothetical protein
MKSNKKSKTMKKMRMKPAKRSTNKNKNTYTNTYKNTNTNTYKKIKQHGGTAIDTINQFNDAVQTGQSVVDSTTPRMNQDPSNGIGDIVEKVGDDNTTMGRIIETGLDPDSNQRETNDPDPNQTNQKSKQFNEYLAYIQKNPNFIQSTLSTILVKPTAYVINELGNLLNVDMNDPEKFKTQWDEMNQNANMIDDPIQRNKVLNYNAQVLAVYLTASKPSIDIISGIFSQEVSEVLGDIIYNMSLKIQNMIPIFAIPRLFNDIPLMIMSIVQAGTTLAQLANTGAVSTQENLQKLNNSIMNEVDVKNKLIIEQTKQAEILEKQNKLVEFILEKPEIIDSYIQYLNKYKNENIDIKNIIPESTTGTNQQSNQQSNNTDTIGMTGGKTNKTNKPITTNNMDKVHESILYAIKESLNDYNKMQSK